MSAATLNPLTIPTSDGRTLSALHAGEGPAVVVFEAGLGMSAPSWGPVLRLLAPHCQVLAYNRAGIGESIPDREPRTLQRLADDLATVARHIPHGQLILVGHSWGGPILRTVAATGQLSDTVRGIVLVDPSDEHLLGEYHPITLNLQRRLMPMLARFGLLRRMTARLVDELPASDREQTLAACCSVSAAKEASAELAQFLPGMQGLHAEPLPVPSVLLTGTQPDHGEPAAMRERINAAHRETAEALGAQLILAEQSGHRIPCTQPELIAQVVRDLLEKQD